MPPQLSLCIDLQLDASPFDDDIVGIHVWIFRYNTMYNNMNGAGFARVFTGSVVLKTTGKTFSIRIH